MKPRFAFWLFCLLIFSASLYSGDIERVWRVDQIFENGFTPAGASFWASGGAGIANPNNAEALFYNPAWSAKTKYTVLIGGLKRFENDFVPFTDANFKIAGKLLIPSYFMATTRFKQGMLFVGYQNAYYFKKEYSFEIRTIEHPEGTGEFMTLSEEQILQNFFFGFNRQLFGPFNVGFQVGLIRYNFEGKKNDSETLASGVDYNYDFKLGLNYKFSNQTQISLIYHYLNPVEYKIKYKGIVVADSVNDYQTVESVGEFRLPWFLDLGVYFRPLRHLRVMLKLEYQEWEKVSKYYDNRLQLAVGATVTPNEHWKINFGAFTSGQYPEEDYGIEDTPFLTAGIDYRVKPGLMLTASALSNTFFVKKINDNAKQINRSQILFGLQWMFE